MELHSGIKHLFKKVNQSNMLGHLDKCREQNYSGNPKKSPKGDPGGPFLRDKGDPWGTLFERKRGPFDFL